jgi:putative NADH-flavin reductase
MRIFLAGATGVIGVRLVPLLVAAGHQVTGMTRSPGKVDGLRALGAEAVVADVFDAAALRDAVVAARPDAVLHELTDLPDEASSIPAFRAANARIRRQGTANLLAAGGVVLRYGQFYGPGTYHEQAPLPPPRVHVDQAARRTVAALEAPTGVLTIVED